MTIEAKLLPGSKLELTYDEEDRDQLVKSAVLFAIQHAVDMERIGELEEQVRVLTYKNQKLRKKCRALRT